MFHKLKQIHELRKKANVLKAKLASETVSVENKAVHLTMDGNQDVKEVVIKTEFCSPDKKHQLEQFVKDSVNEGIKKAQRVMATKIRESGEFNIPGLT